jgi:hypothetical protein
VVVLCMMSQTLVVSTRQHHCEVGTVFIYKSKQQLFCMPQLLSYLQPTLIARCCLMIMLSLGPYQSRPSPLLPGGALQPSALTILKHIHGGPCLPHAAYGTSLSLH